MSKAYAEMHQQAAVSGPGDEGIEIALADDGDSEVLEKVGPTFQPSVNFAVHKMLLEIGPSDNSFLDRLTSKQITQSIRLLAERDRQEYGLEKLRICFSYLAGLTAFSLTLLAILSLCWMFLAFRKPEQDSFVPGLALAFATGLVGGFGFFRARKP